MHRHWSDSLPAKVWVMIFNNAIGPSARQGIYIHTYITLLTVLQKNGQQVGCWLPWSSSMPTTYFVGFQQLWWLASKWPMAAKYRVLTCRDMRNGLQATVLTTSLSRIPPADTHSCTTDSV